MGKVLMNCRRQNLLFSHQAIWFLAIALGCMSPSFAEAVLTLGAGPEVPAEECQEYVGTANIGLDRHQRRQSWPVPASRVLNRYRKINSHQLEFPEPLSGHTFSNGDIAPIRC